MRVFLLCLLLLMPQQLSRAADSFIDVVAPAGRKLQFFIGPARALSGPAVPELGRELGELFAVDLGLAGPFKVSTPEAGAAGADLVLKTSYAVNGTGLILDGLANSSCHPRALLSGIHNFS